MNALCYLIVILQLAQVASKKSMGCFHFSLFCLGLVNLLLLVVQTDKRNLLKAKSMCQTNFLHLDLKELYKGFSTHLFCF